MEYTKIAIDGDEYPIDQLTEEQKKIVNSLTFIDKHSIHLKNKFRAMALAKEQYLSALKSEVLNRKTGYDFTAD